MQILLHAAQSLLHGPLYQITNELGSAFQIDASTTSNFSSAWTRVIDGWSESIEKLYVHVAILVYLALKCLRELARLLRRSSKDVVNVADAVLAFAKGFSRPARAVADALAAPLKRGRMLLSAVVNLVRRL